MFGLNYKSGCRQIVKILLWGSKKQYWIQQRLLTCKYEGDGATSESYCDLNTQSGKVSHSDLLSRPCSDIIIRTSPGVVEREGGGMKKGPCWEGWG